MSFRRAVQACPALIHHLCDGLQALSPQDRRLVVSTGLTLRGSVNVDHALRQTLPNDPRWDYVVGIHAQTGDRAVWIEVHPASSTHVDPVLNKLAWLKQWIAQNAAGLCRISAVFVWAATGRVAITPNSPQSRKLSQAGIILRSRIDLRQV